MPLFHAAGCRQRLHERFVGSVLSPLLANIALHGLEDAVQKTRGPATIVMGGKRVTNNVYCIRYAADFVVFHNT
jgi:RNA-directed DNA polymerase